MPKYVIQREYLLPVYQYLIIEANTLEEARRRVLKPSGRSTTGTTQKRITTARRCPRPSRMPRWSRTKPRRIITSSRAVRCNNA